MEEQSAANLSIQLYKKLSEPCPVPSKFSICRVPDQLRKVREKTYEPLLVSIGPYHRGKPHLLKMEEVKMWYLRQFLSRGRGGMETHEEDVRRYVKAIGALEQRARQCYGESISLDSEEFVQMLLLDACFIIKLICSQCAQLSKETDLKFELELNLNRAWYDLLLLENQLPFFVVLELCNQMEISDKFTTCCIRGLNDRYTEFEVDPGDCNPQSSEHLLDLLHRYWLPFNMRTKITKMVEMDQSQFIRCATELQEAGIKLKKADDDKKGRSLFDIRFENGILEMPTFTIDDETETLLRNLIAYEQLSVVREVHYVTDYATLMDCLINTKKDVQLLSQSGIIDSYIGDDEVIVALFNRIGDYVILDSEFCYSELFNKVNKHCLRKLNRWKAILWHDYFNSPWAMISFLAAVTLGLLTLLQTAFTIASYYHSK